MTTKNLGYKDLNITVYEGSEIKEGYYEVNVVEGNIIQLFITTQGDEITVIEVSSSSLPSSLSLSLLYTSIYVQYLTLLSLHTMMGATLYKVIVNCTSK